MQKLALFILRIAGWKCEMTTPNFKQGVIVVAPHTSNWDFLWGKVGYAAMGRFAHFAIKKEWFSIPILGSLLKKTGGIPVDRSKATHFTDEVAAMFLNDETFSIAIAPEGTRKLNPRWKRGFYHIAVKANVPIALVKIDYEKKCLSLFELFIPSGDEHADIKAIKEKYRGVVAKNPHQFSIDN